MNYYLRALNNYANFEGRDTRPQYWYFFLFNFLISFGLGIFAGIIRQPIIGNIYSVALLIPSIAAGIRRMHDVGKSGWFILIPIYNIILLATEGDAGDNEYGADPRGGDGTGGNFGNVIDRNL